MNNDTDRAHEPVALASSWYARMLGGGPVDIDEATAARLPHPIASLTHRVGWLRGLAIWALAGRGGALVLKRGERGALATIAASAWLGRRRMGVAA